MKPKVFYLYELDPGSFPFKAKWWHPNHPEHNKVFSIIKHHPDSKPSQGYIVQETHLNELISNPEKGIGWTSEHDAADMIDKTINSLFIKDKV